jgi:hypothetical protein
VLRHDKLVEVVRRAMRQGGVTSSKEPLLAALQPGPRIHLPRAQARGDIIYVLTNELQVGDVSGVHPGTARYRRAAAATPGAAAAQRTPRSGHGTARMSGRIPLHAPLRGDLRALGHAHDAPAFGHRQPGRLERRRPLYKGALRLGRPPGTQCEPMQDQRPPRARRQRLFCED